MPNINARIDTGLLGLDSLQESMAVIMGPDSVFTLRLFYFKFEQCIQSYLIEPDDLYQDHQRPAVGVGAIH